MNVAEFFAAAAKLPVHSIADVAHGSGVVIVAQHPDDESLGCGALIAAGCAAGLPVALIVISDGVGSHPNSRQYPPSRLRVLREAETVDAAAQLGLSAGAIHFFRLPDRAVPTVGPEAEQAREKIRAIVEACRADTVFVTWKHDPHCDHLASATLVSEALAEKHVSIFQYPVWGWTLPASTDVERSPKGFRLAVGPHAAAKQAAIAAHRSQTTDLIDDDVDGFRLTPDMLANFAGPFEIFLEVAKGIST